MNSYRFIVYDALTKSRFVSIQYAETVSEAYGKAWRLFKSERYSFPILSQLITDAYKTFVKKTA